MEIDLVYLWVDGSDPVWRAKKNAWLNPSETTSKAAAEAMAPPSYENGEAREQAVGDCRFADNDELRYSLRSAEKYAPWIRTIYLVTAGQTPVWLDTSNPRVKVIDQDSLLDHAREMLPVFNSNTIELNLWRIPGLSECFLYANDDMFFSGPVDPSFFFDEKGHPIVRLKKQSLRRHLDQIYPYTIWSAQQEVRRRFGKNYTLAPHHGIDAYNLTSFRTCVEEFSERVAETTAHRFRTREDLQRAVLLYYALAKGEARQVHVSHFDGVKTIGEYVQAALGLRYYADSRCMPLNTPPDKMRRTLKKYNPRLLCLNDGEQVTEADRIRARKFMEELFPEKSAFEK